MNYDFSEHLLEVMRKLSKRDVDTLRAIKNKIEEIVNSDNVEHYKPLRYDLKNLKRVHIKKSFVLVFEYNKTTNTIWFLDFDHHDKIYQKHFS